MAKLDVREETAALVMKLADAADDQYEFENMLTLVGRFIAEAQRAQLEENEEAKAGSALEKRAAKMGKTVDELKEEFALLTNQNPANVKAKDIMTSVIPRKEKQADPKPADPAQPAQTKAKAKKG